MMTPAAHMSTAGVYSFPVITSGATYAGVPHCAISLPRAVFIFFASPKSAMRRESSLFFSAKRRFSTSSRGG